MTKFKIQTKQINSTGNLAWEYNPLYNLVKTTKNSDGETERSLSEFDTEDLKFDINYPVDIECQPSYDGSVNLILNDDNDCPRIINSGFSLLEDNSYERVVRNQLKPTNVYHNVDLETRLQRTSDKNLDAVKVSLQNIYVGGELKGGNYVFLFKYMDDDLNVTRIIAESRVVSIFKNDLNHSNSVVGTLEQEKTNLAIELKLSNIDDSFSKIQVLYRRNYSDLTGTLQREYCQINEPFKIKNGSKDLIISITGIEPTTTITYDDIIKNHNIYHTVKTQAQVQNKLFFGNVKESYDEEAELQNLAYQVEVSPTYGRSLNLDSLKTYKNVFNIYDNLGYMPGEYYRLGIVFVYNDESISQVYNLRGCCFSHIGDTNIDPSISSDDISYNELFIKEEDLKCYNTRGVFKMPELAFPLISTKSAHIYPILLKTHITDETIAEFSKFNIRGYFFVRQARIPLFLGQGLSLGVSKTAYCPLLSVFDEDKKTYKYGISSPVRATDQGDIASYGLSDNTLKWFYPKDEVLLKSEDVVETYVRPVEVRGLLCNDVSLIPQLQSQFDGSDIILKPVAKYNLTGIEKGQSDNLYSITYEELDASIGAQAWHKNSLIYVPAETPMRIHNKQRFSSKCGSSADVRSSRTLLASVESLTESTPKPRLDDNLIRGNFCSYLGVCGEELKQNMVYNIYSSEYPGTNLEKIKTYIKKLAYNNSEFYSVSDKFYNHYNSTTGTNNINQTVVFSGGDCFYCDSGVKIQYNFLDAQAPLNMNKIESAIPSNYGESDNKKQFAGELFSKISADGWLETNVSDWNAVHFGAVLSYPHMSNYNISLRAIDDQKTDERALYGDYRKFWPNVLPTRSVSFKLPESTLLPLGLSSTLGCFPYFISEQVPFTKKHFENRIAFSNVQANDSFSNSYRVFTGLSYQDIERTYGAIVKLVPLGSSLFCVFEHGCGIVPINEKALLSTAQGQSIHLYGSQVIQSQVTVVSQDYGSTWENSIVVTPNGIYGVDTWAKKIWRYNTSGFSIISDQLIQRYLNDNITLSESDIFPVVAVKNVKSHYNNYKGDVMFTFYNNDVCWNLCFNERVDKFITRYSWTPLLSENIQNSFVSIDKTAVENYALTAKNSEVSSNSLYLTNSRLDFAVKNTHKLYGIIADGEVTEYTDCGYYNHFDLGVGGFSDMVDLVGATIKSVSYATWDSENNKTVIHTVANDVEHCFKHQMSNLEAVVKTGTLETNVSVSDKSDLFCIKWGDDLKETGEFLLEYPEDLPESAGSEEFVSEEDSDGSLVFETLEYNGLASNDYNFSLKAAYNNFKLKARNYVAVEKGEKLSLDVKLNDFICWLKIELEVTPYHELEIAAGALKFSNYTKLTPFKQTICLLPDRDSLKNNSEFNQEQCISDFDNVNRIGFYTHGRAGIYDEINYTDDDPNNEIKPTFWYNKQEPFEFEFVINTPAGMQKIFDNLVVISNNAEPESLEFSIIGDAYEFNKAGIFRAGLVEPVEDEFGIIDSELTAQMCLKTEYDEALLNQKNKNLKTTDGYTTVFDNVTISKDPVLKQHYLHINDTCRNVDDLCSANQRYGVRRGNIEYREDRWLINITPIKYKDAAIKNSKSYTKHVGTKTKSTKIRDKWCKVRIKYKGDKLIVISAIQTMFTLSYS